MSYAWAVVRRSDDLSKPSTEDQSREPLAPQLGARLQPTAASESFSLANNPGLSGATLKPPAPMPSAKGAWAIVGVSAGVLCASAAVWYALNSARQPAAVSGEERPPQSFERLSPPGDHRAGVVQHDVHVEALLACEHERSRFAAREVHGRAAASLRSGAGDRRAEPADHARVVAADGGEAQQHCEHTPRHGPASRCTRARSGLSGYRCRNCWASRRARSWSPRASSASACRASRSSRSAPRGNSRWERWAER